MHTLLTSAPSLQTAVSAELSVLLLGPSTSMSNLWYQVRRLAPHVRTVLLTGPPNTGQEATAHLLLDLSPSPHRPFLHWKEAEAEERLGRVSALSTFPNEMFLFLPEVERLSAAGQNGLLRLLRTRRARGLTVVAATLEDLRALVSVGRFSGELAECLGAVRVSLPALKDRAEDIPMLLGQMLSVRCQSASRSTPQLSEDLLRAAMKHPWTGNLRELSDVADALLAEQEPTGELRSTDLLRALSRSQLPKLPSSPAVRMIKLDTVVQEHIYAVLRGCQGNKLRAAETLGISRSTLYRMLDAASQNTPMPLGT